MTVRVPRWVLLAGLAVAFPWLPGVGSSTIGAANLGAAYALVAVSLVLLTGWVGQISLAHAAFVGVGAYATGWAAAGIGLPFPLSLPFAAAAAAGAAALLGVVALRVRGLFLAVATLIFSWMASEFLFRQELLTRHYLIPDRLIGGEGTLPSFDFTDRRTFFYVAWGIGAAGVFLATNLRDSKTGRAFFAIRGSEMATASLGIDVVRYKLLAFALSGAFAGAAGNVMMSNSRVVTPDQFTFTVSLFFLSIAVVGGLRSLGGAVGSSVLFAGLGEVFFRVPALGGYLELVSAAMLAVTLLVYPQGLAGLAVLAKRWWAHAGGGSGLRPVPVALPRGSLVAARRRLAAWLCQAAERAPSRVARPLRTAARRIESGRRRLTPEPLLAWAESVPATSPATNGDKAPAAAAVQAPEARHATANGHDGGGSSLLRLTVPTASVEWSPRQERRVLVEADGVTVRFGGLTAVRDASLQVREGEVTGLIGPNGAGKTTLFNAVAGFVTPTEGCIRLFEADVTDLPVHARAQLGVARTFQAIQLFPQLTVFDNLLVATHLQNPTSVFTHMVVTAEALRHEAAARRRVGQVLELLGLEAVAHRRAGDLPFGLLRMVELARAVVTGFRVMMLDEPASGLDNRETDRLIEMIRYVRNLGVSILLIEHDVRMVTAVSDYLYVLEQGEIIAEGRPDVVQNDPAVIAAYLGAAEDGPAREEAMA